MSSSRIWRISQRFVAATTKHLSNCACLTFFFCCREEMAGAAAGRKWWLEIGWRLAAQSVEAHTARTFSPIARHQPRPSAPYTPFRELVTVTCQSNANFGTGQRWGGARLPRIPNARRCVAELSTSPPTRQWCKNRLPRPVILFLLSYRQFSESTLTTLPFGACGSSGRVSRLEEKPIATSSQSDNGFVRHAFPVNHRRRQSVSNRPVGVHSLSPR